MKWLKPINSLKKQPREHKKLINVQTNLRISTNPKKSARKTEKTVKVIDDKIKHDKNDGKTHKKKSNSNDIKKDKTNKNDSMTDIQVSDLDTRTEIKDNDSEGWRHLPEIPSTS